MRQKTDGSYYTTLELIRDILVAEMGIDIERVNIFNQKFKIPTDDGLFITIEANGAPQIMSNRNITVPTINSFTEVQEINTREMIAVSFMSRNLDAYTRAPEALMAIASLKAQQVCEQNAFKIARISPIVNLSGLEGSAMLYRYEISLVVFGWYEKTKAGDYFDTFTADLYTEKEEVHILT